MACGIFPDQGSNPCSPALAGGFLATGPPGKSGNDFLDVTSKSQFIKEIIDQLDLTKNKNFCSAKDTVKRMRRQTKDWEKIFPKDTFDEELVSKVYKEFLKLNNKKINNLI